MKKKLDTNQITNELKGQSLYFEDQSKRLAKKIDDKPANARTDERPNARTAERVNARTDERTNARTSERTNARTSERTNARTSERTNARTSERANARTSERANARTSERTNARTRVRKNVKRIIKRHSYQFYIDQVEDIKSLWISYQARGMDIELSDLAREAFDAYLTRIKEKANERTNE